MKNIIDFNKTFESFKHRIQIGFTIIPASIRYDRDINDTLKIIYAVLLLMNNTYEYVYASNEYLSELLKIPNSTLRENLYKLKSYGYIEIKDNDLTRYIQVRKDDLNYYKSKIEIDVSTLDYERLSNYYSLMPGYVLLSIDLSSTEKILYAEIMALTNKYGFAFISNQNLSKLMNISERQLIRCLNNLIHYNFIRYGKDVKSKRLIYVNYHFKKEFKLLDKEHFNYEIIESENNGFITVKKSLKNQILISDQVNDMLDDIYKKLK
jgi:hypothetical protein